MNSFFASPVVSDLFSLAVVSFTGLLLGRIKVLGIRLGVAGVLFSGIICAHFGLNMSSSVLHFLKEFGLLLFVFTLGLQMGPGFFASFRKEGIRFNLYAVFIVLSGLLITILGSYLIGTDLKVAAGLFAGATTNTPALGAAQQAIQSLAEPQDYADIASVAYATAYPFGVIGLILSILFLKRIFKVDLDTEILNFKKASAALREPLVRKNFVIENHNLENLKLSDLPGIQETHIVISRIKKLNDPEVHIAIPDIKVGLGDVILAVGTAANLDKFRMVVGAESQENLMKLASNISYRRVVLTNSKLVGKTISEIGLEEIYGVNLTRITRQDIAVTAVPDWRLQFGDMLQIVGDEANLDRAASNLGDSVKLLNETNFVAIFIGIILGILLGLYPFYISGLPAPVRLGTRRRTTSGRNYT
jgi:putative transport protein